MKIFQRNSSNYLLVIICAVYFISCSKSDSGVTPPPVNNDPCLSRIININATATASTPCNGSSGSITATATGSTGFTFKLNIGGVYQPTGSFNNLAAGTYSVFAKDVDGCEKSVSIIVDASGTAGPLFNAVKSLVNTRCRSCHNNSVANGGMNFELECNIITNKDRINTRAVIEGTMPQGSPLPQSERDIITNWITAGGKYSN